MNKDELHKSFQRTLDAHNQVVLNPNSHEYRIRKLEEKILELENRELLKERTSKINDCERS